jgi:hypothetical protein
MMREPGSGKKTSAAVDRELRLKAALKANMGRRKLQARERGESFETDKPGTATAADNDKD